MIHVTQFLGTTPPYQTTVQGDFSDGKIVIETVLEKTGTVITRWFKLPEVKGSVSYVAGAGRLEHVFEGNLTPEFLKKALAQVGVVFDR